jgi:hypothetical protein
VRFYRATCISGADGPRGRNQAGVIAQTSSLALAAFAQSPPRDVLDATSISFKLFFCLDARVLDNLSPFDDVGFDDVRELLWRTIDRIEA